MSTEEVGQNFLEYKWPSDLREIKQLANNQIFS